MRMLDICLIANIDEPFPFPFPLHFFPFLHFFPPPFFLPAGISSSSSSAPEQFIMALLSFSPSGVPAVHQKTTSSGSMQRPSDFSISSPDSSEEYLAGQCSPLSLVELH